MSFIAPNLSAIVGPTVATKLMGMVNNIAINKIVLTKTECELCDRVRGNTDNVFTYRHV